jgi:hypothetical protein
MTIPGGQFGLRGGCHLQQWRLWGKKTNSMPVTMSVMVGLKFSCAQASAWGRCKKERRAKGMRAYCTSGAGELPSARDRVSPQQKLRDGVAHCDRTRCAWGVCPWPLCTARTSAGVLSSLTLHMKERKGTHDTHVLQILMTSPGDDCTLILEVYCSAFASVTTYIRLRK